MDSAEAKLSILMRITESKRNSLRKAIVSLFSEWRDFEEQLDCMHHSHESRELRNLIHEFVGKSELDPKKFEPIRESIGEKLKEIDSREAYLENRAKELDLVQDSMNRLAKELDSEKERLEERVKMFDLKEKEMELSRNLSEERLKEIQHREEGLDFAQNFIQECAKEVEAKQKLLDDRIRELDFKEKHLICVKTDIVEDISRNGGAHITHPLSKRGSSITEALASGFNQGQSVVSQQKEASIREGVKGCRHPLTRIGDEAEVLGSSKVCRKEVGHVTAEDVNRVIGTPKARESGTLRNTKQKRRIKLGESDDFKISSKRFCKGKPFSDDKQERKNKALRSEKHVGNSAGAPSANVDEDNVEEFLLRNPYANKSDSDDSEYTYTSNPALYDYPDPEFNNFDKDREDKCFSAHQIWAIYDTIDAMPRFYAEIMKVLSPAFKLQITWLDPEAENQGEIEWVENGFSVACGKFKHSMSEITSDRLMFSHQMHCERGNNRGSYEIYPSKGEIWALFKDWDIKWSSDPENRRNFIFEIVEIVSEYVHDAGIKVAYLEKIKGFVSLFQRTIRGKSGSFLIPSRELLRFSHKIPSFRMTGGERADVRVGSFELDPAALPLHLTKAPDPCPSFSENAFSNCHWGKSDESKFKQGQIWALYSYKDGMPKTYAQIEKVVPSPFKLHVVLLEPCSRLMQPECVGIFKVQHGKPRIFEPSSFSHEVKVERIGKYIYEIYPRKGEIWAIYKNLNAELSFSNMENCTCDIVQILENREQCIKVLCLEPLAGGNWTFMAPQQQKSNINCLEIWHPEFARFSHQIPALQLAGEYRFWKLDPASVPGEIFGSRCSYVRKPIKSKR